jgi:hypothetical protein
MWSNHTVDTATKNLEKAVLEKQLEAARLPESQVQVTLRKALVTSGNVAGIKNTSGQVIAITAEIERPASGLKKGFSITLDPGQTREIGGLEGWAFAPGDKIRVSQPGHKVLVVTTQ